MVGYSVRVGKMLTGCSLTCFIIVYKYIFYRVDDLWITIYMAWNELKLKLMLLLELNKLSTSVSIESLAVYATVAFVTGLRGILISNN